MIEQQLVLESMPINVLEKRKLSSRFPPAHVKDQSLLFQYRAMHHTVVYDSEVYTQSLTDYILQDSPVQPYLVTGEPGVGKSLLLARWVEQLNFHISDCLLLYHFVQFDPSGSFDPMLVTSSFAKQLLHNVPACYDPQRLEKDFPKLLERASLHYTNGVIIVIDGADSLLKCFEKLKWLVDPLPVRTRAIISVDSTNEGVPLKWLAWPTLQVTGFTPDGVRDFLGANLVHPLLSSQCQSTIDYILSSDPEQELKKFSNPMFSLIASYLLMYSRSVEEYDETLNLVLQAANLTNLFEILIKIFFDIYGIQLVTDILLLTCFSYDGVTESELMTLVPQLHWIIWSKLKADLLIKRVFLEISGVLKVASKEVRSYLIIIIL